MGHFVTGLVAKPEKLESFARKHSLHAPITLTQSLAILPLRPEDIDSILPPPLTAHPDGFNYLCEQLVRELSMASSRGSLMYFETEYFGGEGAQGATVFRDGTIVLGPKSAETGPINEALALLGVRVIAPARDEFETLGLDRHRHTEDWLGSDA
ncbi:hypothetical protein SAMN05216350_101781 [Polaromonas sp. YR568]|uniref:hypothetical protein n=1 Tax=Polaromonas sp. YR568 TaxID=1855301 RepID=UPI0008E3462E|nr:hypothetical protein [Polaromonas sp. YR568]SFU40531.1 hypothetical protein SAMN05216350_101781 [Polaromonas sp. YR568]